MILNFLRKNWFLLGILFTLFCGFLIPDPGRILNPSSITASFIVIILFFITGFTLPSEAIKIGLRDLQLHIYIQTFIFFIVPLYFVFTSYLLKNYIREELIIGIYALSCLPTTVSSCIIFTQLSGGNVVGTMFNASFSNVLGTIISPLLLSFLLKRVGQSLPVEEVLKLVLNICLMIFVPFIIGQVLRFFIKDFVIKHKKKMAVLSNILILIIIYFALSKTAGNTLLKENINYMLLPFGYLAISNILLVFLSYSGSRILKLNNQNTISIIYTAPQKTLAMGVPLLSIYFSYNPDILGLTILPLLFYHPWQLIVAGIIKGSSFLKKLQRNDET